MKFVIAPDKFKGSLTGFEFCDAVEEGLRMVFADAEIHKTPLADGGDGTIDVVRHYINGEKVSVEVHDPLFRPITASYLYSDKTKIAYIEMAEASGLKLLLDEERDCTQTTTLGTGELIANALEKGAAEIILGIGGSATNDGGMGMAVAMGFRFLDENNEELKPIGGNLMRVRSIDSSNTLPALIGKSIKVACDVTNPLYGPNGAAFIYGRQKGASDEDLVALDKGLENYAQIVLEHFGTDVQHIEGAGAAGGMGAGAIVFLGAELTSGIELIKSLADFEGTISGADWIITGEGMLDGQTLSGKTINGVVTSAQSAKIPVAAFCGSVAITIAEQQSLGLSFAVSIIKEVGTLKDALQKSRENLKYSAYNFAKALQH
ncbi:MAG: glycerate kinase [Pricia sp.]|nr:glycerate kinase [Pricia sp.]